MKKKFTTYLDEVTIKEAKIQALIEDISVAQLIQNLLDEYLEKQKKKK